MPSIQKIISINKYKHFHLIILSLAILHFLLLTYVGISLISTTLLFYYLIYKLIHLFTLRYLANHKFIETNLKVCFLILITIELALTFVLKWNTSSFESKYSVYSSPYICFDEKHYQFGYEPFITYFQNGADTNFRVTYNSVGLRGKVLSKKKENNEYRIAILGDSFIEGYGAGEDSTIPMLLEKKLQQNNFKVNTINAGICGSNPLHQIKLYQNVIQKYQPDLVIMTSNITDLSDVEYISYNNKMPLFEYFFAVSHIFRAFYVHFFGYYITQENTPNYAKQKALRNSIHLTKEITKFKEKLKRDNKKFIFSYIPLKEEIIYNKQLKYTNQLYLNYKESNLIDVDLKTIFKNDSSRIESLYQKNDFHNNANGYYIISNIFFEHLVNNNYIVIK